MGAERSGHIIVDGEGSPWCSGGLCVTPRDFARVGDLLVNDGRRGADEIVPKAWIDDLCDNGDREAWDTGEWRASFASIAKIMSYRAGWYAVHDDPSLLFAMGTHGQNLFIDRANRVVIAKLSSQANRIDPRAIGLTHMALPELIRCALAAG
jgi:CubicO group peptidase (beta-lactamase class C family)